MSAELVTVSKAHLMLLVQAAYEEGSYDRQHNLETTSERVYQDSTTREQLNKLLKGE